MKSPNRELLTNTLLAPTMLALVLGGWLATWAGYWGMFAVSVAVSLLGGALLAFWVREPRKARGLADRGVG